MKIDIYCRDCGGIGIQVGFCYNGAGIVCGFCGGTGKETLEADPFVERKKHKNFKRVYKTDGGYNIHAIDKTFGDTGKTVKFSEAGCSYEDWLAGAEPLPIKDLHCPYLHYRDRESGLYEKRCKANKGDWAIEYCKLYGEMDKCWEIYEQEQSIKDVKSDLANGNYVIETAEEHCKRIADNVPDASKMVNNRLADIRKTIGELLESN